MTARAVRSALAQRPDAPAEVVVVDDCSSDETGAAGAAAGARVIRPATNRVVGGARNTRAREARGPWAALLATHDKWLPAHLPALWPHREGRVVLGSPAVTSADDLWGRERDTPRPL